MKTFGELVPEDIIYKLKKRGTLLAEEDKYGNIYHPTVLDKVKIRDISTDDDRLIFNRSNYDRSFELSLTKSQKALTKIELEDYVYYSNEESFKKDFRYFLVDRMKESEKRAQDAIKQSNDYIREIRKKYWTILNP